MEEGRAGELAMVADMTGVAPESECHHGDHDRWLVAIAASLVLWERKEPILLDRAIWERAWEEYQSDQTRSGIYYKCIDLSTPKVQHCLGHSLSQTICQRPNGTVER